MKRRNLSGILIFEKFKDEKKRQPTCIEDCQEETQDKWLKSLNNAELINLTKQLSSVIRELGDKFNISCN